MSSGGLLVTQSGVDLDKQPLDDRIVGVEVVGRLERADGLPGLAGLGEEAPPLLLKCCEIRVEVDTLCQQGQGSRGVAHRLMAGRAAGKQQGRRWLGGVCGLVVLHQSSLVVAFLAQKVTEPGVAGKVGPAGEEGVGLELGAFSIQLDRQGGELLFHQRETPKPGSPPESKGGKVVVASQIGDDRLGVLPATNAVHQHHEALGTCTLQHEPDHGGDLGEGERRLVAQLLTLLDGLKQRSNLIVIGATNRADALDEALRRPGRFDRELVLGVPDAEGRREIMSIHTRGMPLDPDVDIEKISLVTHGFVGADLSALCREAALETLRRNMHIIDLQAEEIPVDVLEKLIVNQDDFNRALKRAQPTALREIMIETPKIRWDDIGGLQEVKEALREGIELPLKRPEAFARLGIRPAKGFLLYGPPGTGKTLLAKAVAREADANFISVRSSDLLSKWYGESEKQIAKLFQRARQVAPTVIFIDEIDSLVPRRGGSQGEPAVTERVVNTILAEMDGLEEMQSVVLMGATNQPMLIDPALMRPGRFDELIYVPVPEKEGRRKILGIHAAKMPLGDDVDLDLIADKTKGYSGADLEDLVRRAGFLMLRSGSDADSVPMAMFEEALKKTRASVTDKMQQEYREMKVKLHSEAPQKDASRIGFG